MDSAASVHAHDGIAQPAVVQLPLVGDERGLGLVGTAGRDVEMGRKKLRGIARAVAAGAAAALLCAGTAAAHDSRLHDDGAINSGKETHTHDSVQHGGVGGHLPARRSNVDLVGKLDLFTDAEQPGRIGDVSAKGNYAGTGVCANPNVPYPLGVGYNPFA